jgi:hypothetical protein
MPGPATSFNKKKYNKDGTEATRSIREDIGKALEDAFDDPFVRGAAGAVAGAAVGRKMFRSVGKRSKNVHPEDVGQMGFVGGAIGGTGGFVLGSGFGNKMKPQGGKRRK